MQNNPDSRKFSQLPPDDELSEDEKPNYSGSLRPELDSDGDPIARPSSNSPKPAPKTERP